MTRCCLVALALCFVACDVEPEQTPQALANPDNPYLAPDGDKFEYVDLDLGDDPGDVSGDPCACLSDACFEQWANANLGCQVCVTLVCPDATHHTCSTCEPPATYPYASASHP